MTLFLNGNIDVITRILEFVTDSSEELNSYAMVSRTFRLARENPRLDQTRTGTIIIKTPLEDIPIEVWQRWDQQVFTGNRVRLVAILTQLPHGTISSIYLWRPFPLTKVREVVLQRDPSVKVPRSLDTCDKDGMATVRFFQDILPNLDILDIGALAVTAVDLGAVHLDSSVNSLFGPRAFRVFRCTAEVVHRGWHFSFKQPRSFPVFDNNYHHLREIHIDPFGVRLNDVLPIAAYCKEYSQLERETWFDFASSRHGGGRDWVLLQEYPNLERVTLKHAEYELRYDYLLSITSSWTELPQEALIKFVRHTPKLRWFCSDLTQDNIAILKEERPEVDFCK
jgi:hypothetical protein